MADSILRLKVESQEYDAKLKRAVQGLQQYADGCRKVGGTLEVVEKDTLAYVRAIGQMETTAKGAKATLAEMTKTFTDLSVQYNKLTDAEKKSPFGQALKGSLDQLQGRIRDSKTELDNINQSINGGGGLSGALDGLAGKFGMNITQLAGWGTAIGAAKVALDVAKDAFFASEATVDEWGRVVDSSKSLYEGFLTALNTGDISGYLSRIDEIVSAARTAYNELDRLGTMKTIQAPKMSAQQTENERMRMMIQTGRYIAPVDGRRASMKDGQLLTPEQIRRIEQQLQNGMKAVVNLVGNEVKQTGKAIDAVYNRQAKELGLSLSEFKKGTSSMAEFDKRMAGYDQYQKWREQHTTIDLQSGRETVARGNPYQEYAKWGTFRVDGERYNDLVRLIQQRDQQALQAYGMQSQAYRTMNRAEGVTLRSIMGGNSGGRGGGRSTTKEEKDDFTEIIGLIPNAEEAVKSLQQQIRESWDEGEIASLTKDLQRAEDELNRLKNIGKEVKPAEMTTGLSGMNSTAIGAYTGMVSGTLSNMDYGSPDYTATFANMIDAQTFGNVLQTAIQQGVDIAATGIDVEGLWDSIVGGENIPDEVWQSLQDKINEQLEAMQIDPIKIDFQTGSVSKQAKKMNDDWKQAASAIQSVGAAMMSIEDPAAKVMGTIAQAIASIALGAGQAIAQAGNGSAGGPWGWIAFAAAATATMISTIASVKSATAGSYAEGGIVPGNSWHGDNLTANVNSGELILTRAQQNNLASQLQGGGMGNMNLSATISGEQLRLVLNNNSRRRGHGEYVTTNFR